MELVKRLLWAKQLNISSLKTVVRSLSALTVTALQTCTSKNILIRHLQMKKLIRSCYEFIITTNGCRRCTRSFRSIALLSLILSPQPENLKPHHWRTSKTKTLLWPRCLLLAVLRNCFRLVILPTFCWMKLPKQWRQRPLCRWSLLIRKLGGSCW